MTESYIIAGLGFGDEGKGSIVDFLARKSGITNNVRYNGGQQAAHHVVYGKHEHCFSQFGSATFLPQTRTIISKYMLFEPYALETESEALETKGIIDPMQRMFIDNEALVVTPMHKILNRMKELESRIGSCGLGVGEAVADSKSYDKYMLKAEDLRDEEKTSYKLDFLLKVKLDQAEQIYDSHKNEYNSISCKILSEMDVEKLSKDYSKISERVSIDDCSDFFSEPCIYEGSQGVLLDVDYGFWPFVTKTKTTFENAEKLCRTGKLKIGVMRPYMTRHGRGPLPTQDENLSEIVTEKHNSYSEWQGQFRIGWMDILLMKYANEISGKSDFLAITNVDKIKSLKKIKLCNRYEYFGNDDIGRFFEYEKKGRKKLITGIKTPLDFEKNPEINDIFYDCCPVYDNFYPSSSSSEKWDKYLKFLESEEALATPIGIISRGPEAKDKEFLL